MSKANSGGEVIARFGRRDVQPFAIHPKGDQYISEVIRRTGVWEPMTTQIVSALLRPGDTFLDIGANIGWYSALAARLVGESGTVVAIEPDPVNCQLLLRNTARFPQVSVRNVALADQPGQLLLARSASNLGDHRLATTVTKSERETVTVHVETLDSLAMIEEFDVSKIRVVKIDTQGAETLIFRGAKQFVRALPASCGLVVEFAPNLLREHADHHPSELVAALVAFNRPMYMVRKRTLKQVAATDLLGLAEKCRGFTDEIAVDVFIAPSSSHDVRNVRRATRRVAFTRR
jgi:FkbM family methyltransferase